MAWFEKDLKRKLTFLLCICMILMACTQEKIDRKKVVQRHHIAIEEFDSLNSLTLGNGKFALTMDVTGLQSFPDYYQNGVPLGTLSDWGWHSFPSDSNYTIGQTLKFVNSHGRQVPYAVQWPGESHAGMASEYIRQNPHRMHLATIGWHLSDGENSLLHPENIGNIHQELDLWDGILSSQFEIRQESVQVISMVHPDRDELIAKASSQWIERGELGISIRFPVPTGAFIDTGNNFVPNETDRLQIDSTDRSHLTIRRQLDTTVYYLHIQSSIPIAHISAIRGGYSILPKPGNASWQFRCTFTRDQASTGKETFEQSRKEVIEKSRNYWNSGGMIDFGNVRDSRAKELERRMIHSIYLTKINCRGNTPPQETGLVYNSWYGKPHLEMAWWHLVHFAFWGRHEILENQMNWYLKNSSVAAYMAQRQGFKGIRWQKMTDPWGGETTSSIGSYLLWQQPHFIYFAELLYRLKNDLLMLHKYGDLVDQTAEFMADFAWRDLQTDRYILGPGIIPAQERFDPETTINPTFELAYWRWGLQTAQQWRERRSLQRNAYWDQVLSNLSDLPVKDSLYLAAESVPDSYENRHYMTDHPSVLAAYGMLPATDQLDIRIMENTFNIIKEKWQWDETWGWDFPLAAMTAARLGKREAAVELLLLPMKTNTYLKNGHNYQNERLRLYLPGNGGLLSALALMSSGTEAHPEKLIGFPEDWNIKVEDISFFP